MTTIGHQAAGADRRGGIGTDLAHAVGGGAVAAAATVALGTAAAFGIARFLRLPAGNVREIVHMGATIASVAAVGSLVGTATGLTVDRGRPTGGRSPVGAAALGGAIGGAIALGGFFLVGGSSSGVGTSMVIGAAVGGAVLGAAGGAAGGLVLT